MGLEDRQYIRDEQRRYSGMGTGAGGRSMVTTLVIINVIVFVLDTFSPQVSPDGTHWLSYHLGIQYAHPWYLWTYLTHGFAHASYDTSTGIFHIAGNMITLWFLGRPVEQRLGGSELLRFYLISIVVSGLGFALIHLMLQNPFGFIVGASGGVSAVVALFIFMYPKQQILLMGIIPMPAWLLGVLLLASNFMSALNPGSHIAWEAHLFGAAFGCAYYLLHWNFGWLSTGQGSGGTNGFSKIFQSGPKLKVHHPDGLDEKLKLQADEILEKISREGEQSLSSRERKTLNKYSQQLRKNR